MKVLVFIYPSCCKQLRYGTSFAALHNAVRLPLEVKLDAHEKMAWRHGHVTIKQLVEKSNKILKIKVNLQSRLL